jgi:hypothetical protein
MTFKVNFHYGIVEEKARQGRRMDSILQYTKSVNVHTQPTICISTIFTPATDTEKYQIKTGFGFGFGRIGIMAVITVCTLTSSLI